MSRKLLITCEHGGHRVPQPYATTFQDQKDLLESHRGWDPGARNLAHRFARILKAPLLAATTTRLLVDLNRSPGHPSLFGKITRGLSPEEKRRILDRHYWPYRREAHRLAAHFSSVLHLSIHSFTPELDGRSRNAEIGLLYDPRRPFERALARAWRQAIRTIDPHIRVRLNYPYRGIADGLATSLRKALPPNRYAGIEVEVCQSPRGTACRPILIRTFRELWNRGDPKPR